MSHLSTQKLILLPCCYIITSLILLLNAILLHQARISLMRILSHQHALIMAIAAGIMRSLFLVRELGLVCVPDIDAPVVAVVVFESVRLLAVDGVVADFKLLVGHAEGDAADVFDEAHDEGGPDNVPADNKESSDDLETDLAAIAGNRTSGVGDTKSSAALLRGPET